MAITVGAKTPGSRVAAGHELRAAAVQPNWIGLSKAVVLVTRLNLF